VRRATALLAAAVVAAGTVIFGSAGTAFADPSANDWKQLRLCESGDNYSTNTGNAYYGAYQFDLSTWKSVGGVGRPDQASRSEQDFRALYLYRMRGWSPWICAALVGLHEDADGGSGRKPVMGDAPNPPSSNPPSSNPPSSNPPSSNPPSPNPPSPTPPASNTHGYPGPLKYGDYSAALKTWQKQLAAMGYGSFDGTGWFGEKTRTAVKKLQSKAGQPASGTIGEATWVAAWNAKYRLTTTTPKPPANTPPPAPSRAPTYPGSVLREGSSSTALKAFQKQLGAMGYGLTGTGYYGSKTTQAVLKLQTKAGLNVVGYVGPSTWKAAWNVKNKIAGTPEAKAPAYPGTKLSRGSEGEALQKFQKQLGVYGYGLTGTGWFGPNTEAAVKKLQQKAGLHVVGFVGPETWYSAWDPANDLRDTTAVTAVARADMKPAAKPAAVVPAKYLPATDASCRVSSQTALRWGGVVMVSGKTYRDLQCFQRALGHRGYGLTGTGYFGPATRAAVASLQASNSLPRTGKVDAATWKAAWQGR